MKGEIGGFLMSFAWTRPHCISHRIYLFYTFKIKSIYHIVNFRSYRNYARSVKVSTQCMYSLPPWIPYKSTPPHSKGLGSNDIGLQYLWTSTLLCHHDFLVYFLFFSCPYHYWVRIRKRPNFNRRPKSSVPFISDSDRNLIPWEKHYHSSTPGNSLCDVVEDCSPW